MADKMIRILTGPLVWILSLLWLAGITLAFLWPASWWFEVHDVRVSDGKAGEQITMVVGREIKRDFEGSWSVSIRQIDEAATKLACVASSKTDYRTDAQLPAVLTIGWWTNGVCSTLPPGHYVLTTTWYIYPPIGPTKTVRRVSNIFKVTA